MPRRSRLCCQVPLRTVQRRMAEPFNREILRQQARLLLDACLELPGDRSPQAHRSCDDRPSFHHALLGECGRWIRPGSRPQRDLVSCMMHACNFALRRRRTVPCVYACLLNVAPSLSRIPTPDLHGRHGLRSPRITLPPILVQAHGELALLPNNRSLDVADVDWNRNRHGKTSQDRAAVLQMQLASDVLVQRLLSY